MRAANLPHCDETGEPDQRSQQTDAPLAAKFPARFDSRDLEWLFAQVFLAAYDTRLEGGAAEPVYLPGAPHRILYTRDYFRSALHEVAHWCVAGAERRHREDYGYWYAPDGRDAAQQASFLHVEVAPQALELLFCAACGHDFRVSLDNLNGDAGEAGPFSRAVHREALARLAQMGDQRWARWLRALSAHYRNGAVVTPDCVRAVHPGGE
ncbi:hypothetical protein A167_02931 [Alcanivorax sp. S71-1-4]|jgi:elongation factor P hydroxylase|uniref:elongation factor P hydroxylase n=1 Tax=Alcanivorax sp. S71-1-4 TaxID=1177159 RepID=UPI00135CA57D|nr:elongation factor P hydroxylase [Alcanivorax sp. S71-1-4]KAF0807504.1 hypothetical protein A167_02931 [Alcanivorax sp. S71-1-4]